VDFGPQDKFENNSKEKYSEKWKIATLKKQKANLAYL
jgi:hypothetical protein